jgi:hypothetical protein
MRTRSLELTLAIAAGALVCGCPPTSLYRTAEPVARGETQLSLGGAFASYRDVEYDSRVPAALVELGGRHGISENADVGVRLVPVGLDVSATLRFLHRGGWSLAVAPQLTGLRTPRTGLSTNAIHAFGMATGLATYRWSRSWAFTFGPSVGGGFYWPEAGGSVGGAWVGTFVNVETRLGERWWLVPEVGIHGVFTGEVPVRGSFAHAGLGLRFQL